MSITGQALTDTAFRGTKLLIFAGDQLVTLQRDDIPSIPWPDHWDFPGGGREGTETAVACTLRETREELGLEISPKSLIWARRYFRVDHHTWFFAAQLPATIVADIQFGNEGQSWRLMAPDEYLTHPRAIPHFQARLADYIANC
ncbi:NUDIX hydrolase [Shimia sp. SK013]|uniref:NUDIX hydrolase n=1 Tax=Shimia sp. SK013 TaxID=1389006 RepID=UPI0006B4276E|nr:NUDIX hydrolase [Shimia sp. SK013]